MALVATSRGGTATPHRDDFAGTPQQEAIWAEVREGSGHLVVEARAGTGKSATTARAIGMLPRGTEAVYCAFNKHIAAEFQDRAPRCRAATMHSLGFAMLRDALGDVAVEAYKSETLAEKYFPGRFDDRPNRAAVAQLVGLAKNLLLDEPDDGDFFRVALEYGVALPDRGQGRGEILAVAGEVLRESRDHTQTVDYDDMIWLPVVLGLASKRPADVLFIDEAQDTNACQIDLAGVLCPAGRIVVVGDPRQAIYGFRGADADAMGRIGTWLERIEDGVRNFPLTITWRCPRSHVELANALVPDLQAAPTAIDGEILSLDEPDVLAMLQPGDMALCRTNAPLVSACYRLLRNGTRAVVRGRDIGKGLLALVARLRAGDVPALLRRLDDYRVREQTALNELRNPGPALVALQDRVECLATLAEGCRTVDEVKARITSLFSDDDERGAVVLSSVHRAKGLERDTIAILRPELLPHPASSTLNERHQEENLAYVALTRSKNRLIFAGEIPAMVQKRGELPL